MTTRSDLLEIIANGNNSGVEFKKDHVSPLGLAGELVAFSNLAGGMVILEVEDDGSVSGLTRGDLEEWVMSVCRDKIRPGIVPFFEVVRGAEERKDVAIVRVTHGYCVHSLRHDNSNRYLIRAGTQSREASQEELASLFQQRSAVRTELQPVSGAVLFDLDQRRLQNYFVDIRQQDVPVEEDEDAWRSLLLNTGIMDDEGVTVGGMLLFGKTPNRFLSHAGIQAVVYSGSEQSHEAQERMQIRGPMTPLLSKARDIVENGVVEQALEFIRRNTRISVERPAYPPDALRESIVNALTHRDYLLTSTDIVLAVYDDRLEIISPGRLPNGITTERMRTGTRVSRNQLLKDIMRDYGYLEHMGMGVPRKIVKGMKDHNGSDPDLLEQGERFIVRLSG